MMEDRIRKRDRGTVDPVSGFHVVNWDTTPQELIDGLGALEIFPLRHLHGKKRPVLEGKEWVTYGVVASRSDPLSSSSGGKYLVVQLFDMTEYMTSLLVFGDAVRSLLTKLTPGTWLIFISPLSHCIYQFHRLSRYVFTTSS
jgi:hypothetical protein